MMGETTGISWCDHTFNPVIGCVKVSPGCEHCYAETLSKNRMGLDVWGPAKTTPRKRTSEAYWRKPIAWNAKAERDGVRRRVFCGSMCDWAEDHPTTRAAVDDLVKLWVATPWLDWLMLTKRIENVLAMFPADCWGNYPNVWIGTSVEDQMRANQRVPLLAQIPAAVRFLSVEPLLGPVVIPQIYDMSWVIVGGESGPGFRPMDLDWARAVRDQCRANGVPFFFKQQGGARPGTGDTLDGVSYHEFPGSTIHWELGHDEPCPDCEAIMARQLKFY